MVHRIEIGIRQGIADAFGERTKKRVVEDLNFLVGSIRVVDVYSIDAPLDSVKLSFLAKELFCDPIIQEFTVDEPLARDFDWIVEVGPKPGVTDNAGKTARNAVEDILKFEFLPGQGIYSSRQYLVSGADLSRNDIEIITARLLANSLVQRWSIYDSREYKSRWGNIDIPRVFLDGKATVERIDLEVSESGLQEISRQRKLALNILEMKRIRGYFSGPFTVTARQAVGLDGRATDVELEALGQSWSEHCKHKIFNARVDYKEKGSVESVDSLFDTCIKGATKDLEKQAGWIESAFWDNAGVVRFDENWLLALKCETHNSPSNEEPYGGALTGIVGVYRDPMGTGAGARLIFGTYGFCTGNPEYKGNLRPKIAPKRLLEGVRQGVQDGGNKSGVPTPYGFTFFDNGYMAKPAIFVCAGGLIPARVCGRSGTEKKVIPGDLIVMVGGRVGIDGIHGATESSMEAGAWISATHVQIGDPFTQKKVHDFLLEARDAGLYEAITDNGAGGLSSSVGEMARLSNGFELHLDRVPQKYPGLNPWQILVSESQERMTLAVNSQKIGALMDLARIHDVETTVIGKFTATGKFHCLYNEDSVAYLDMGFVHEGAPRLKLDAEWATPAERGLVEPQLRSVGDDVHFLKDMLARPNICGKEYIVRQYDHEVQGTSVIKPLVGKNSDVYSDAAVLRPVQESKKGIAIAAAINPDYGLIDTYHMAALAVDEAIRRVIAVGANPEMIVFNDNFCWPSPLPAENNPDSAYKAAQLVRACRALYDMTRAFGTPLISGKDSMSMDGVLKDDAGRESRISALPTLLMTAIARITDISKCVTMDIKNAGDLLYVVGETRDELGGSEYYRMREKIGVNVPRVEAAVFKKTYQKLNRAIEKNLVASCHGVYKGGLAVALSQIAFAGDLGLEIDLALIPAQKDLSRDTLLYSESAGRFLVTVPPECKTDFELEMEGTILARVGRVGAVPELVIMRAKKAILREELHRLKKSWQRPFKNY